MPAGHYRLPPIAGGKWTSARMLKVVWRSIASASASVAESRLRLSGTGFPLSRKRFICPQAAHLSASGSFVRKRLICPDRPVTWDLRLEVTEAYPLGAPVEINFCNRNSSPLLRQTDCIAFMVEDGGNHPIAADVFVGAADQVDMILAGSSPGQERVAAPHRPGDHLGAAVSQLPGHFRKEAVVADHHPNLAEARLEYRILASRGDAGLDLGPRQGRLAVFSHDSTIRPNQHRHVVDQV